MSELPDHTSEPPALPPAAQAPAPREPAALAPWDPASVSWAEDEEHVHLREYWEVLRRRRWLAITVFLVVLIAGTVWTYTTPPVYTATATIHLDREEPRILQYQDVVKVETQWGYFETQYNLLQSRLLAQRVIKRLALDRHPEFLAPVDGNSALAWTDGARGWFREQAVRWLPLPPPAAGADAAAGNGLPARRALPAPAHRDLLFAGRPAENYPAHFGPIASALIGRLHVEPVKHTQLVRVSYESRTPELAARVVNELADVFSEYNLEYKVGATRDGVEFLTRQLAEAQPKLEESEARLSRFLAANDILFTPDKPDERLNLTMKELGALSDALIQARTERDTRQALVEQLRSESPESLGPVLDSPLILKLKQELAALEGEQRKLGQTFKPEYPRMQRLRENLEQVREQIAAETGRIVESIQREYRTAVHRERRLQQAFDQQRELTRRLGNQVAQFTVLRREVDSSREHYTALYNRLREIQLASVMPTSKVAVVDRAEVPGAPSRPNPRRNLLFAVVLGLVGGVGLAFVLEYFDTSLKAPRDVERALRVPAIAVVPSWEALPAPRGHLRRRLPETQPGPFALVAHEEGGSAMAEIFRHLRSTILYSAPDRPPKTLLVTSLETGDGKTSIVTNLAIVLAQLGKGPVVLVDADMRRPTLHLLFGMRHRPGLSDLLTGQAELAQVLRPTAVPDLHLIPAGPAPLNPAELLASARFQQALDVLAEQFAHVLLDCPPLFGVSDALAVAPGVGGVLLVLRHGSAGREGAQRAVRLLLAVHARLLGVVLNDVELREMGGYYGYYGYYGGADSS